MSRSSRFLLIILTNPVDGSTDSRRDRLVKRHFRVNGRHASGTNAEIIGENLPKA
jgi:hypothetical protein